MNRRRLIAGIILIGLILAALGIGYIRQMPQSYSGDDRLNIEPAYTTRPSNAPGNRALHKVDVQTTETSTPGAPERLTYGNTVKRSFVPGAGPFVFTFQAQAGDVITLTMVATPGDPLDPALALIGPDGKLAARNDDSLDTNFGVTNARLVNFPISASGTYTIQAMRSTSADGGFTLMLSGTRAKSTASQLDFGDTSRGSITSSSTRTTYQFHASAGDVISIVVQAAPGSNLVPYVMLLDESGSQLVSSNPAERTAKTIRIIRYPIQNEGNYTIVISRVGEDQGTSAGAFSVSLTRDANYAVMNYGDALNGAIDDNQTEIGYLFSAAAGDIVTITMTRTNGTLDSALSLLSLANEQLAAGATSGQGLKPGDARISKFQIPATASYVIMAGRKGKTKGATIGTFRLSLQLITAATPSS